MPAAAASLPAAIVLAGGRSTRMGGGDKSLELLGGRPLIAHVLDRLAPQAERHRDQRQWRSGALRRVRPAGAAGHGCRLSRPAGRPARRHGMGARPRRNAYAVSMPTDTPFFPADLGARSPRRQAHRRAGARRIGRQASSGLRRCGRSLSPARLERFPARRARPTGSRPLPMPATPSPSTFPMIALAAAAASIRSSTSTARRPCAGRDAASRSCRDDAASSASPAGRTPARPR